MKYFLLPFIIVSSLISQAQDTTRLSLLFAGDIMGHDSQIASAYNPDTGSYDYSSCFQFVKRYLESADIAIGNLELTLAGPPYTGYPQFSSPVSLAVTLKKVGFDVLVTANNHAVDRGKQGIEHTISVLDSLDIMHTGTFTDEVPRLNDYPMMLRKNGFTIALMNYTFGTNGIPVPDPAIVNQIDTVLIGKDIQEAKQGNPDIMIAFMHWGNEYENLPVKSQEQVADFCFKKGVQVVIGSHPHVLQPMEWRKARGQFVVYSLGNFVSGQRKRYTDGGTMAYIELEKIRYRQDSTVTSIDSAGYYLQWVYRTADEKKDYFILPVQSFEKNPEVFIKDEASLLAFRQFINDSRQHYGHYNSHVDEIMELPQESAVRYKVHLKIMQVPPDTVRQVIDINADVCEFFGYERITSEEDSTLVALGNFRSRSRAETLCAKLIGQGEQAEVVRYTNGLRDEE
jgi:poly-gamma-glutamate capsule biosynthesis protein CapA/YwtB (metallophosphatase superfamily)